MIRYRTAPFLLALFGSFAPLRSAECDQNLLIAYDILGGRLTKVTTDDTRGETTIELTELCLKHGGFVVLRVNNLNTFLYTVSVDGKPISLNAQIPSVFAQLSQTPPPEPERLPTPDAGKEVGAAEDFGESLKNFRSDLYRAYTWAGADVELSDLVHYSDGLNHEEIVRRAFAALNNRFGKDWKDPLKIPGEIVKEGNSVMLDVDNSFGELEAAYKALKGEVKAEQTQLARIEALLEAARTRYQAFTQDRPALTAKFENARSISIMIRDAQFTVNSPPIQAAGDQIQFSLQIQRNAQLDPKFPTVRQINKDPFLTIDVRHGIKVDFSTGVFVTNVRDQSFTTQTVDGKKTLQRAGSEDSARVVAGALMHVYRKTHPWVNPAGSFGLGVGGDSNMNYFFGVSSLFGKESRAVLSVGATVGSVKRLGGGLSVGDEFSSKNNTIPTESKLKFGFFVGFSFNVSSLAP